MPNKLWNILTNKNRDTINFISVTIYILAPVQPLVIAIKTLKVSNHLKTYPFTQKSFHFLQILVEVDGLSRSENFTATKQLGL